MTRPHQCRMLQRHGAAGRASTPSRAHLKRLAAISLKLVRSVGSGSASADDVWAWMTSTLQWAAVIRGEGFGEAELRELAELTRVLMDRCVGGSPILLDDVRSALPSSDSWIMQVLSDCIGLEAAASRRRSSAARDGLSSASRH